jgi:hypothetical protein
MAMHLNNIDRDKIRKQGPWSSDTFLMFIHEQISTFSTGLAMKMSQTSDGTTSMDQERSRDQPPRPKFSL